MRRQAVLIIVIAFAVIAIFLLRPRNPITDRSTAPHVQRPEGTSGPSVRVPAVTEEDVSAPPLANPRSDTGQVPDSPPAISKPAVTPKPTSRAHSTPVTYEVTVLNPDLKPVPGAEVVVFRTSDNWKSYEMSEIRTDAEGKVWVLCKDGSVDILLHSYKKGEGYGSLGLYRLFDLQHSLKYLAPKPMKLWCRGDNGDLRSNTHLRITAELNQWTRSGDYVWLKLPTRNLQSDEYGKLEVEGFPTWGPTSEGRKTIPLCRFAITATCETKTAEMKFDDFPKDTVHVIVE